MELKYRFDGSESHWTSVQEAVMKRWQSLGDSELTEPHQAERLLLKDSRKRIVSEVSRLLKEQDQRPISIVE